MSEKRCFARACRANHEGICTRIQEEFLANPCPMLWLLTGWQLPVGELLKEAERRGA